MRRPAALVAAGILVSRIIGLIRQRVFAHFFGTSDAADAFWAAFRIPNLLQNLFGEGALSASFIPVYAGLLGREDRDAANRVAGAVFALLGLAISVLVLGGVLATPLLIDLIAPGFDGSKRELTITLVRIFFPGAGLLVLSAWCLGILNSHRRFFLSYAAPVVWNAAIIAALTGFGGRIGLPDLAVIGAWGSVIGSALQFGVQLPVVLRVTGGLTPVLDTASAQVREVARNFLPAFMSRGAAQLSAYVDTLIASLLPAGAVAALGYAQQLYMLPVSLFGMSISAAELPAMAGAQGDPGEVAAQIRRRLDGGLRQIAFYVIPAAATFLALGHIVAGALYQTGNFTADESRYVWGILAGSAVGLLASTMGRLYSSTFYALRDTRTPLRFAAVRVALAAGFGYLFAFPLPVLLEIPARWGAAGLTASAGVAGWIEFALLRRALNRRVGPTGVPIGLVARLWAAAIAGVALGWFVDLMTGVDEPIFRAILVLGAAGLGYLAAAIAFRVPEARGLLGRGWS